MYIYTYMFIYRYIYYLLSRKYQQGREQWRRENQLTKTLVGLKFLYSCWHTLMYKCCGSTLNSYSIYIRIGSVVILKPA